MPQETLDAFGAISPTNEDETDETANTARETDLSYDMALAPPDKRGGHGCCPWCAASPAYFEYDRERDVLGCTIGGEVIPVRSGWYWDDEKVFLD